MFSFRVNLKGEIKHSFSNFLHSVARGDWVSSVSHLMEFEERLCQHLLLRGDPSLIPFVRDRCRRMRLYLNSPLGAADKRRCVFEHLKELKDRVGAESNPPSLERIYEELREDWSDFWERPSPGTIGALKDDLDLLGLVEPQMRKRSDDEYRKYREVLERRGKCYTVMPYMEAMAKGISLSDAQRKQVFECFSQLFESLEALMAPYKLEYEAARLEVAREEE